MSPPKLTGEDRRSDIEFLARWARDYSPLVELNEKHKGTPSYEALLPQYAEFAAQAKSDDEFCLIVLQYFKVMVMIFLITLKTNQIILKKLHKISTLLV